MISVMIIAVLSLVAATLFTTVNSGLRSSRADQDRTDAFQFANAGIDHALYRVDSTDLPTSNLGTCPLSVAAPGETHRYCPEVNSGVLQGFEELIVDPGQSADTPETYRITAKPFPHAAQTASWKVHVVGTDGSGRRRQAVATIRAELLFEDGFFTEDLTEMNGGANFPEAYNSYDDANPSVSALASPYEASVGTNGKIELVNQAAAEWNAKWRSYNMYGRATMASALTNCVLCLPAKVQNFTDRKETIIEKIPANATGCPNGGNITQAYVAANPLLPGDYTCDNLSFSGTIDISGTGRARFWPKHTLTVANGSVLNGPGATVTTSGGTLVYPAGTYQPPRRLQIFYYNPQIYGVTAPRATQMMGGSKICRAQVWGLLYTPALTVSNTNGCGGSNQPSVWGAANFKIYRSAGSPNFRFVWDKDSQFELHTGKYRVLEWRECPPDAAFGSC